MRSVKSRHNGSQSRRLDLEPLEDRLLLAFQPLAPDLEPTFDPTAFEQEMLEHLNRMRLDPQGELAVLFTSIDPLIARDPDADAAIRYFNDPTSQEIQAEWAGLIAAPPVAWNVSLYDAAVGHSALMILYGEQSHQLPGEPSLQGRIEDAGYLNWIKLGENVFAYANSPFHGHSAFAIDWAVTDRSHRNNIMDLGYREVGIAIVVDDDPLTPVGPLVVTQDFGNRTSLGDPYLLGAIFEDVDQNALYDAGEGLGNVTIAIDGSGGMFQTTTMSAGGYQVQVPAGTYTVTASGGGLPSEMVATGVVVNTENVKIDFLSGSSLNQTPGLDLNGPEQEGTDLTALFAAGQGPVPIVDPALTIDDPDNSDLASANVTITNPQDADAELLQVDTAGTNILADFDSDTAVLTLSGTDTRENYEQVLRTLQYDNTAVEPSLTPRVVELVVNDGAADSNTATSIVSIRTQPAMLPEVSIDDAVVVETDYGTTEAVFSVSLSRAPDQMVTVNFSTADGTALAAVDYQGRSGQLVFLSGQTTQTVSVPVIGDTVVEADETFFVNLSNPNGVTIVDLQGEAKILDDDMDDMAVELGTVDYRQLDAVAVADEPVWYKLQPARDGLLTVATRSITRADDFELALLADAGNVLATAEPVVWAAVMDPRLPQVWKYQWRLDHPVVAGQTYFVRVTGSGAEVDLRLCNLLSQDGTAVTVYGTEGDDTFGFIGFPGRRVVINGIVYGATPEEDISVTFDAGLGSDVVYLHGSPGDDTVTVSPGSVTASGPNYTLDGSGFEILHAYGTSGGTDVAFLHGSPKSDKLDAFPQHTIFYGKGFYYQVEQFDAVHAYGTAGGNDRARLYDSPTNDKFKSTSTYAIMQGNGFYNRVKYFETVIAYATAGGNDRARLFDSPGNDKFIGTPAKARMYNTVTPFDVTARMFEQMVAYSTAGGHDRARLFDSPGNDTIRARSTKSVLWSGDYNDPDYKIIVRWFDQVRASAISGGYDVAKLHDTAGDDLFEATPDRATLSRKRADGSLDLLYEMLAFERVRGYGLGGGDDTAILHDTPGDDDLLATKYLIDGHTFVALSTMEPELRLLYDVIAFDLVEARGTTGKNTTEIDSEVDFLLLTGAWEE